MLYRNLILVPGNGQTLLPCVLMAELINKAGIPCSVYSLNPEKLPKLAELHHLELVFSGDHAKALALRGSVAHVELGQLFPSFRFWVVTPSSLYRCRRKESYRCARNSRLRCCRRRLFTLAQNDKSHKSRNFPCCPRSTV